MVRTLDDLLIQSIHVLSSERRLESSHFVYHTAQGPDIGFGIVGLILPHLRACIVRRSSLSVEQSIFGDFGHIHVSQLGSPVLGEEHVSTLGIRSKVL